MRGCLETPTHRAMHRSDRVPPLCVPGRHGVNLPLNDVKVVNPISFQKLDQGIDKSIKGCIVSADDGWITADARDSRA